MVVIDLGNKSAEGEGSDAIPPRKVFPLNIITIFPLVFFYGFIKKSGFSKDKLLTSMILSIVCLLSYCINFDIDFIIAFHCFPKFLRWMLGSLICSLCLFHISLEGVRYPSKHCFPMAFLFIFLSFFLSLFLLTLT